MATQGELQYQIRKLESEIKTIQGNRQIGLKERREALAFTEQQIAQAKDENNTTKLEYELKVKERIEIEIASLEQQLADKQTELTGLKEELTSITTQQDSAKGQTAAAAATNAANPNIVGEGTAPLADTGALSAKEVKALETNSQTIESSAQTYQVPTPGFKVLEVDEKGDPKKTEIYDKTIYDNDRQKELSVKPAAKYTNILHNFAGYTYRVTLFLLTKEDYDNLSKLPDSFEPRHVLISSGGTYANPTGQSVTISLGGQSATVKDTVRHPDFLEDFFIENLQLQTVVGLNAKRKSSNSIDISFNIIEPYGMTLLDRLLSACEVTAQCPNYIEQPYLLQIDFLSNTEEAFKTDPSKPAGILINRKRIAIKFIEFKIKPGVGGTEYRVRAIPYNHSAFNQSNATLPINLAVEASTVGDFFASKNGASKAIEESIQANQERVERELEKWVNANFYEIPPTAAELDAKRTELTAGLTYNSTSLPAGYNEYMISVSKKGKLFVYPQTLIGFKIDKEFENSPLINIDLAEVANDPMLKASKSGLITITSFYSNPDYKAKQIYNIHYGTDIVSIIDRVMQTSQYIKDQVLSARQAAEEATKNPETRNSEEEQKKYKFLNWYKIIPQVRLLEFDKSRNAYSKMIIFNVVPYKVANPYHPDFAKTKINKNKISRTYEYLYTGRNEDIVNVDIDFDLAFYAQLTTYQDSKRRSGASYNANDPFVNDLESRDTGTNRVHDIPVQYGAVGSEQQGSTGLNRGKDSKDQAVASLIKSIYTSSRGDMLNLKLRIVGDPSFIKQDEVYYNPSNENYKDSIKNVDPDGPPIDQLTGQIFYDLEQIYVQFITKSAVDIDDNTGITNKQIILRNGRKTDSTFSGVYKVLKVSSELVRGKFEQVLELVRMPNDFTDTELSKTDSSISVAKPTTEKVATTETPTASLPAVDSTNLPQIDSDLRIAGGLPGISPVINIPGIGTTATVDLPSQALPSNINDTRFINI